MGKAIRLARLTGPSGCLMVPLDHGVSMGAVPGLVDVPTTVGAVAGLATCVTVHKGLVGRVAPFAPRLGILLHMSASTDGSPDPLDKQLVASVEEAVRMGCDGVSIHVNVGSQTEARQLAQMGAVAGTCQEWGMPLVAMMYPRGPQVPKPARPEQVAHAARLGAELGADLVKVPFTGDEASFRQVVQGAGIPVIVAGGPRRDDLGAFLEDLRLARRAGAAGASVGRNVFQADDIRSAMTQVAQVFA